MTRPHPVQACARPPRISGIIALAAAAFLAGCGGGSNEPDPTDVEGPGEVRAATARAVSLAATLTRGTAPVAGTRGGGRTTPAPTAEVSGNSSSNTNSNTSGTQVAAQPIRHNDIRLQVDPDRLFSSYQWLWGVECAGLKQGAVNIAESGLHGFDLGGGLGTQRFGKVSDPDDPSRRVLMFRPHASDPQIYGGPRCELTFSPSFAGKLPVKQDFWFAFGMRFQDWTSSSDEQVLMQWHWSNGSIAVGPFLALAMKAGRLQIDSKANAVHPPSPTTTHSTVHWTGDAVPNRWTYFVVKARISPQRADAPYLQVWRDGVQIVNHQGPLGYNYPEVTPYLKIGHYQWVTSYNTWDATARTKTVLVRTPALVDDADGRYAEPDLRAHVTSR